MKPVHVALAILVAVLWGIAFVVSKIGLESFTPPQLTALRFVIASLAIIWFPRPPISWTILISIGLTIFLGQFLLQFFGIANGMPAGLTAVVVQTQALFTVLFAALTIGDRPSFRQILGMGTAVAGLVMIGLTMGGSITLIGFTLTLASAVSWAIGNVLLKRQPKVNTLHLMAWASLVPPLPALAISFVIDEPGAVLGALVHASWLGLFAPISRTSLFGIGLRRLGTFAAALFDRRRCTIRSPFALRRFNHLRCGPWRTLRSASARRGHFHVGGHCNCRGAASTVWLVQPARQPRLSRPMSQRFRPASTAAGRRL
jgi:O-acetylserine/cysteine efflux transporter